MEWLKYLALIQPSLLPVRFPKDMGQLVRNDVVDDLGGEDGQGSLEDQFVAAIVTNPQKLAEHGVIGNADAGSAAHKESLIVHWNTGPDKAEALDKASFVRMANHAQAAGPAPDDLDVGGPEQSSRKRVMEINLLDDEYGGEQVLLLLLQPAPEREPVFLRQ